MTERPARFGEHIPEPAVSLAWRLLVGFAILIGLAVPTSIVILIVVLIRWLSRQP